MGEVLLAHDELLNRRVALKRLRSSGDDPVQRRRAILQEARRASQINDRRIAAIYDVLDLDDEVLLVMEYVDGVTLRQRMSEPVPLESFWSLAIPCVEAIATAHAHGVIHRDIKPENLMVTRDGEIKILDFGISKRIGGAVGVSTTFTDRAPGIAGTPRYMAPEAHLGGEIDERTDLFSLGVVFYELLTGREPFSGQTYAAVLDRVLHASPPAVVDLSPAAGPALSGVVAKMLAKDPAERYSSSSELMGELVRARHGSMRRAPPERNALPSAPRRARRWTTAAVSVAGIAVAVLAWGWWKTAAPPLPRDRNVALLTAASTSPAEEFASFAVGALELLNARLLKHVDTPGFQMTSFQEGLDGGVHSALDARKVLGANLALVPTLEQQPDILRARLRLLDTTHGRVLASRTVQAPASLPFEFLDRMHRAAATMLELKTGATDAQSESGIRGAGTLRFYLRGLGRLRLAETEDAARRAVADFELACNTAPEVAVPRAALSSAQMKVYGITRNEEWLTRAESSARQAVSLDDRRPEGHRSLAAVLTSRKKYDESLAEFVRASELSPADDELRARIARTYARLGQPEKERDVYLAAIAHHPHASRPWSWLAVWHFNHGSIDEAARAFREAIRRSPELSSGYSSLGGVLVLQGHYDRAIDTLKRSVEIRPTRDAFTNLGTAYFNTGRSAEAIDAYNQAFQFGLADYQIWFNLGEAYFWLRGNKDQAAEAYSQAVRMGRDEILERAKNARPVDPMIAANLATIFPKLAQPDSARVYLAQALRADSTNSRVEFCAALTHWQLGDRDRALAWLERSVQGGYPVMWLRDSPVFKDWREEPRFRGLVEESDPDPRAALRTRKGERR